MTYYPDGRLESVTDALGNTTHYAYELAANTTTTTNPDPAALAQGIAKLAAALRGRLGAANRQRVEESFTFEKMCAAYHEIYESALAA